MKKSILCNFIFFLFYILPYSLRAQENDVEMADMMRSNGKIYVVVAVVSVILAGLIIFLIRIDRKVKSLENKSKNE
jgi:hypothetical protein